MTTLVIFGAAGSAKIVAALARDLGHQVAAFTVDDAWVGDGTFMGLPLVPFREVVERYPPSEHAFFVAAGYLRMNSIRAERTATAREAGYRLPSLVHRTAVVSGEIGDACLIQEHAVVQATARLGENVVMWSGAVVSHETTIGDSCTLAPNATVAGQTTVGERCFLGAASVVINNLTLGGRVLVGAGAVVTSDLPDDAVIVPARSVILDKSSRDMRV